MFRDLKPCIRCKGTGTVVLEMVGEDHNGMAAGLSKCHGCNGTGKVSVVELVEEVETPEPEDAA